MASDLQAVLTEMRNKIQQQQHEIQLLKQTKLRPKPTLPDPEKFSGQQYKFDTWLPSIKAKLRVDGDAIGDAIAQFYYVYLSLDSQVQAMVLPQLAEAEKSESWSYLTILDQLSRVYDNPNKAQEAEDKLYTLKQGTDPIPTFIAKFERVLYEASGQNWPDVNKISIFRNGLNSTIRNRLSQQLSLPRDYSGFIKVVQQLASRSTYTQTSGNGSHAHGSHSHGDPMDTSVGVINVGAIDTGTTSTTSPPPSPPRRARSISPQRRELYRAEGRCVRCGSHDHWVKSCPFQAYSSGKGQVVTTPEEGDNSDGSTATFDSADRRFLAQKDWGRRANV